VLAPRLLGLGLLLLPGCMVGLGQSLLVPPVQGSWAYQGTDLTIKPSQAALASGADDFAVGVQEPGHSSAVAPHVTATQVLVGLDFPRFRFDIAAGGVGTDASVTQIDLLYKHPLTEGIAPKWCLLAGMSWVSVDVKFSADRKLVLGRDMGLGTGNGSLHDGDVVHLQANASQGGWYGTFGVEYEVFEWLHGFALTYGKVTQGTDRGQDVSVTVHGDRAGSTSVLTDARFASDLRHVGTAVSNVEPPVFAVLAGVTLTFPSIGRIRRWVIGPGANRSPGIVPTAPTPPPAEPNGRIAPQPLGSKPDYPSPTVPNAGDPMAGTDRRTPRNGSSQRHDTAHPATQLPAQEQARTST
jgi:hypothetical protein